MHYTLALFLAVGAVAGCSDSTSPDFELQPGIHHLQMSACTECPDGPTPVFAEVWRDGVVAEIDISTATAEEAQAVFLVLETLGGESLLGVLESTSLRFSASDDVYEGSVGFGDGTITLSLFPGGCGFQLEYPGVDTGSGSCETR